MGNEGNAENKGGNARNGNAGNLGGKERSQNNRK